MKTKHEENEIQFFEKSWLLSYADLFTLLFMIITVVASIYYLQVKDHVEMVTDLAEQKLTMETEVFNLEKQKDALLEQLGKFKKEQEDLKKRAIILDDSLIEMKESLEQLINNNAGNVTLEETAEGLVVRIKESLLFASGSASLSQEGQALIAEVARLVEALDNKIRIEGHTDNIPSNTPTFPSNWELSAARSIAVMKEFIHSYHLDPDRFMIAGWGEYKPLVENTTAENRALNRRVEIVLLNAWLSSQ